MKKNFFILIALVVTFAACSKKTAPAAVKDTSVDGGMVFRNNCTRCHGETGMNGRAPNLSLSKKDADGLTHIISNGDGRMPAFSDRLSQKEIVAVADWVLALRK